MKSWVQLSLFVAVTALFALGCGDDDGAAVRLGDEGESCVRTGDCKSGLSCINNFCAQQGSSGAGGDDAGAGAGGAPGPALGGEGESCQARRDCQDGLQCIEQRCVAGGGAGSGGAPAPRLGGRGESCETVSDCAEGLTCLVREYGSVCDLEDFGLDPSGKVCSGECATAEDCCELPRTLASQLGVVSCENLVFQYLNNDVATNCPITGPSIGSIYETPCFYYRTYCECGDDTWSCANNTCKYDAPCDSDLGGGSIWEGCPFYTRNGTTSTTVCASNDRCVAPPACRTPADCSQTTDALLSTGLRASCNGNGCTCFESSCYLKCDEDLDCAPGYECDLGTSVCKPTASCTTDEQCATRLFDATAECRDGACVIPCITDQDCDDSGNRGGGTRFFSMVCNADNFCQQLGCSNDDECAIGGVRMFCVEPTAQGGSGAVSAITD